MYRSILVAPMPKRREMILTSSGWETSLGIFPLVRKQILGAFLDSLGISAENARHEIGLKLVVKFVVDLNGGRPAAGADTFDLLEREEAVRGDAIGADVKLFAEAFVDLVGSAQHATDIGADLNVVFAGRLEAKHGVVGGDVAHLKLGDADAAGNLGNDRVREIADLVLRVEQHGNQRRAANGILLDQRVETSSQRGREDGSSVGIGLLWAHRMISRAHCSAARSMASSCASLRRVPDSVSSMVPILPFSRVQVRIA